MASPLGYREDDLKTNVGISYLTVFPLVWLGDVRRCNRQVEPILGFPHLGTSGLGHHIWLQLTKQHVMSSEGSWRRIQMLMITAKLRSAGKGSSSRVGWHHISWLDLFYFLRFTKDSFYVPYLIPSPKSSRCQGH